MPVQDEIKGTVLYLVQSSLARLLPYFQDVITN